MCINGIIDAAAGRHIIYILILAFFPRTIWLNNDVTCNSIQEFRSCAFASCWGGHAIFACTRNAVLSGVY